MSKSTPAVKTYAATSTTEGIERVFVGVPEITPEGAELRREEFRVGARIQALNHAADRHRFEKDTITVEQIIETASLFEDYLMNGREVSA